MNFQDTKDEVVKWLVPALLALLWTEQRNNTSAIIEAAKVQSALIVKTDEIEKRVERHREAIVKIQETQDARGERFAKIESHNDYQDQRINKIEIKVFGHSIKF